MAASDTATSKDAPSAPAGAVKALRTFQASHGPSVRVVTENIGRIGVRLVLVGEDGVMGDVIVPDAEAAAAVVAAVPEAADAEWDRETVSATAIGAAHRRRMASPR
ncbi:hypothetical protein D5S17_20630 [Pseudonocardiaceae bacterium YIM PH 21723]|nr:hypothetical protein D5S17_20630 [Pseudonocardiaceae bacterium YIM PH 21723]